MSGPYPRRRASKNATVEERLRLHMIEAPSGCWIWTGARSAFGHGRFLLNGRTAYAHRVSYETFVGPIPDGLQIDHLCRRPACIKPMHLQPVTPRTNSLRGSGLIAQSMRTGLCKRGHDLAKSAYHHGGRRYCRICRQAHRARYAQTAAEIRDAERADRMARLIAVRDGVAA